MDTSQSAKSREPEQAGLRAVPTLAPSEQLGWDPRDRELRIMGPATRLRGRHVLEQSA